MSERGNEIVGLVVVALVSFLTMEFIRDVFGRPAAWIVGSAVIICCVVELCRLRNA